MKTLVSDFCDCAMFESFTLWLSNVLKFYFVIVQRFKVYFVIGQRLKV